MLPLTEEILYVYDKLGTCPNLFGSRSIRSIEDLLSNHWKFWLVDDVGLLCFDPFTVRIAHVHITFWDKRLRGRESLCRAVAGHLMSEYQIDTLLTVIPDSAKIVGAFARRVGFQPSNVMNGRRVWSMTPGNFTMQKAGM